jgi:methionine synthase / methylenetetrahydrofolate reductase(NADPH)
MKGLLERLQQKPLLADGAMGTLLYARGVPITQCLEALVVEQPALIAAIHADYARAGAGLITTHTFGANRLRLASHHLAEQVRDFNLQAVALAHQVRVDTGCDFLIAGNVGPLGKQVNWAGALARETVIAAFQEQIAALVEGGVDLLLFETFSDVQELVVAIEVAKQLSALPIVASMSYAENGLTLAGQGVDEVTRRLLAAGVDVIGTNCSVGPAQMMATLRTMREIAPHTLLSVTPNAGLPSIASGGQACYPIGAQEFAQYVSQFLALGARMVGSCCGTTPEYIAAMRRAMYRNLIYGRFG